MSIVHVHFIAVISIGDWRLSSRSRPTYTCGSQPISLYKSIQVVWYDCASTYESFAELFTSQQMGQSAYLSLATPSSAEHARVVGFQTEFLQPRVLWLFDEKAWHRRIQAGRLQRICAQQAYTTNTSECQQQNFSHRLSAAVSAVLRLNATAHVALTFNP